MCGRSVWFDAFDVGGADDKGRLVGLVVSNIIQIKMVQADGLITIL